MELPVGYILEHCNNWRSFYDQIELNPWATREGKVQDTDLQELTLEQAVRYGILPPCSSEPSNA